MIVEGKQDILNRWPIHNRPGLPLLSNGDYAYIPILKNAHTWLTEIFRDKLNWKVQHSPLDIITCKKIVVLRDPLTRWISAMATYLHDKEGLYDINVTNIEILADGIFFDWHTLPQVRFLHGYDIDNCVFFYMDTDPKIFDKNIRKFIMNTFDDFIDFEKLQKNDGSNKPKHKHYKQQLTMFFKSLEGQRLRKRISYAYMNDYELLDYLQNQKIKQKEYYENFNR